MKLSEVLPPYEPQDIAVAQLAIALRSVRDAALQSRAILAVAAEELAECERTVAAAAATEQELLAAIRKLSPEDADILAKAPVGALERRGDGLRKRLQYSEEVKLITHGRRVLGWPKPSPPVSAITGPLTVQELKEFRGE